MTSGSDEVEISFATGSIVPGRVHRRSAEADLALIDIPKSDNLLTAPDVDVAGVGEVWHNPYRPSLNHAFLSGNVAAAPVPYQCEGGGAVEAIQLGCLQPLGDYAGYSGSPIERRGSGEDRALLGVLLEQYPEQYPDDQLPKRASTVLFAATIAEVFRRFDCFEVGHLLKLLIPSSSGVPKQSSPSTLPAQEWPTGPGNAPYDRAGSVNRNTESGIGVAGAILNALHEWQTGGLLEGLDVPTLTLGVVENLISDMMENNP
jgi:hypothetical protein